VAKRFVFLEIRDPEINALVGWLREAAMGTPSRHTVHITIRGPYSREVPKEQLARYHAVLRKDPIVLEGFDSFQAGARHVVYLKVQHPKLRQVWWKPDFPIQTYGFNPHITIFEGTDERRAHAALEFLSKERLTVLTWDFEVTARVSDHRDLFTEPQRKEEPFLKLVNKGLVRADIVNRFERALRSAPRAA
jgi:2'-5' RNA ligase